MLVLIEKYKDIEISYNTDNGTLKFGFEGTEREAKYLFEARQIIDEPVWKDYSAEGYWVDGVFRDVIAKAKAEKLNIKSNKPLWLFKGEYDTIYRPSRFLEDDRKVYLRSKENDLVYQESEKQREVIREEKNKLNNIINKLK